jgi:hypothetical protein
MWGSMCFSCYFNSIAQSMFVFLHVHERQFLALMSYTLCPRRSVPNLKICYTVNRKQRNKQYFENVLISERVYKPQSTPTREKSSDPDHRKPILYDGLQCHPQMCKYYPSHTSTWTNLREITSADSNGRGNGPPPHICIVSSKRFNAA